MIITTVAPASYPVTYSEMKTHLRINDDDDTEQALIEDWIKAATDLFERETRSVTVTCTMRKLQDGFNSTVIELPRYPIASLTSVEYLDTEADWQTLEADGTDLDSIPARVFLPETLPTVHDTLRPTVRVTFTAGTSAASVPALARTAIKLLVAFWYEQREAYGETDLKETPQGWKAIIRNFWTGIL